MIEPPDATLRTSRLELILADRQALEALVAGRDALAAHLGVIVPDGWPEFPEAYRYSLSLMDKEPDPGPWWAYLFIDRADRTLVGSGGFKSRPDTNGAVEFGYETAQPFRGRGFASEAARGLVDFAFTHTEVRLVIAHTLPEINASTRVLEKTGLAFAGAVEDPTDGTIWRWERPRRH